MLVSYWGHFDQDTTYEFKLSDPKKREFYLMVVDGELEIEDENLAKRDAIGLLEITALSMNIKANFRPLGA